MRDRSHRDLSGTKKYSATRWNYDRFMTRESANFGNPLKYTLGFFSKNPPGPAQDLPGPAPAPPAQPGTPLDLT